MGDIGARIAAAKSQVEDLKKQVTVARSEKVKGYVGINKMGTIRSSNNLILLIIKTLQHE